MYGVLGLVHVLSLRIQALLLPFKVLVFSGALTAHKKEAHVNMTMRFLRYL
jgi:hypothetical protein